MEMDAAGGVDLGSGRTAAPPTGTHAVRPRERPGERLVRPVAGLDRDLEDRVAGCEELVRRPFQQDSAPEPLRRLTRDRGDDAVEVEAREVHPRRDVVPADLVVVKRLGQDVHEVREQVVRGGYGAILIPRGPPWLYRDLSTDECPDARVQLPA